MSRGPVMLRAAALRRGVAWAAVAAVAATAAGGTPPPRQPSRLTGAPQLARAYEAVFDARFEEVPPLVASACGPAPREACQLVEAMAIWWRIQLDPLDTSRDAAFASAAETAIASTRAWTAREPGRAESWFYLGAAYATRVQWRVLRGERLTAARDGQRIKDALERALALDPSLADAHLGLGLYHYYADVAPAALRILRWLLLLPGGNRAQGLEEIDRARRAGELVRSEADYQLHLLHLWYEKQPGVALRLLEQLHERHPHNPHFLQAAAEIQDVYLSDPLASLHAWETLLEAARSGRVAEPHLAETAARLGMARQLERLGRPEAAVDQLRVVIAARPTAPHSALARAQLQLGHSLASAGRRTEAAAAYRAAIAAAGRDDPMKIAPQARAALRAMPS